MKSDGQGLAPRLFESRRGHHQAYSLHHAGEESAPRGAPAEANPLRRGLQGDRPLSSDVGEELTQELPGHLWPLTEQAVPLGEPQAQGGAIERHNPAGRGLPGEVGPQHLLAQLRRRELRSDLLQGHAVPERPHVAADAELDLAQLRLERPAPVLPLRDGRSMAREGARDDRGQHVLREHIALEALENGPLEGLETRPESVGASRLPAGPVRLAHVVGHGHAA